MTPAEDKIVASIHLKVGGRAAAAKADVTNGEVLRLINFLRDEERRADASERNSRRVLVDTAERRLDALLLPVTRAEEQLKSLLTET